MDKLDKIKDMAKELNLHNLKVNAIEIIEAANNKDISYQDMLLTLLEKEIELKDKNARERRLKFAGFPVIKTIEEFDIEFQTSITKKQINKLLEMDWIDRMYNLIFLGPPGLGKSHLSISLGYRAIEMGYKVSFVTMDKLMHVLKTQEISRKIKGKINKILSSSLVIIDEVGYLPITREEANLFFQIISSLHEQASVIIT
jgi:DNA replication protein DnaC